MYLFVEYSIQRTFFYCFCSDFLSDAHKKTNGKAVFFRRFLLCFYFGFVAKSHIRMLVFALFYDIAHTAEHVLGTVGEVLDIFFLSYTREY